MFQGTYLLYRRRVSRSVNYSRQQAQTDLLLVTTAFDFSCIRHYALYICTEQTQRVTPGANNGRSIHGKAERKQCKDEVWNKILKSNYLLRNTMRETTYNAWE
jgi:hypothetical protein